MTSRILVRCHWCIRVRGGCSHVANSKNEIRICIMVRKPMVMMMVMMIMRRYRSNIRALPFYIREWIFIHHSTNLSGTFFIQIQTPPIAPRDSRDTICAFSYSSATILQSQQRSFTARNSFPFIIDRMPIIRNLQHLLSLPNSQFTYTTIPGYFSSIPVFKWTFYRIHRVPGRSRTSFVNIVDVVY